jgi:hypothetical protein
MFILNTIYRREQSFNLTSTTSWLMFAHPLPFLHRCLRPCYHQFTPNHPHLSGDEPLPSYEGCGPTQHCLSSLRSEDAAATAPPLFKGMWACSSELDKMEHTRGDPGSGRPIRCVRGYEPRHLSWFVFAMTPPCINTSNPTARTK